MEDSVIEDIDIVIQDTITIDGQFIVEDEVEDEQSEYTTPDIVKMEKDTFNDKEDVKRALAQEIYLSLEGGLAFARAKATHNDREVDLDDRVFLFGARLGMSWNYRFRGYLSYRKNAWDDLDVQDFSLNLDYLKVVGDNLFFLFGLHSGLTNFSADNSKSRNGFHFGPQIGLKRLFTTSNSQMFSLEFGLRSTFTNINLDAPVTIDGVTDALGKFTYRGQILPYIAIGYNF